MKSGKQLLLLLGPALLVFIVLLILPLASILQESFRVFVPGRIGAALDAPLTAQNYIELFDSAYLHYFMDTFRISLISAAVGLCIGYPIAYHIARRPRGRLRTMSIAFLATMMFLSVLVRVYSIALTFGTVGFLRNLVSAFGLNPNGGTVTEGLVVLGLVHYMIPISALVLIGTIQNVNPRLAEAAQSLGSSRLGTHFSVILPLSAKGLAGAFLICYTLCISAFVIPMILGKGRVLFISNLIYTRFSEVADYPSGAAISIVLLGISLVVVYAIARRLNQDRRT